MLMRDSAGWIRSWSTSNSSFGPTATNSSPSSTHRSGSCSRIAVDDLGEVAGERLGVARGQLHLVAVAEDDAAEAVPLRLEGQPAVELRGVGDPLDGLGQHRPHGRHHGKVHVDDRRPHRLRSRAPATHDRRGRRRRPGGRARPSMQRRDADCWDVMNSSAGAARQVRHTRAPWPTPSLTAAAAPGTGLPRRPRPGGDARVRRRQAGGARRRCATSGRSSPSSRSGCTPRPTPAGAVGSWSCCRAWTPPARAAWSTRRSAC